MRVPFLSSLSMFEFASITRVFLSAETLVCFRCCTCVGCFGVAKQKKQQRERHFVGGRVHFYCVAAKFELEGSGVLDEHEQQCDGVDNDDNSGGEGHCISTVVLVAATIGSKR